MNTDPIRRLAEIDTQVKEMEADVKALKRERSKVEQEILDMFVSDGTDSIRVTGVGKRKILVYTHRIVVARSLQGPEATAEAVRSAGHGDLVKEAINGQTLNSLVRELVDDDGNLPDEFDGIVEPFEKVSVRSRLD